MINAMKRAGVEASKASKPVKIEVGTVISISPLKIQISQNITLSKLQLIVPQRFTDHEIEVTIDSSKKTIKVHNALAKGDSVILLRQDGGQKYVVLDRVVS